MKLSGKASTALYATLSIVVTAGAGSLPSVAATSTSSFGVSAIVESSCVASASDVGSGSASAGRANAGSAVQVNCTNSTPYNVALSARIAQGAMLAAPTKVGPATGVVTYSLFSEPSRKANPGLESGRNTVCEAGRSAVLALAVPDENSARRLFAGGGQPDAVIATITY
jgi:spore coat protein U-like protein